MMTMLEHNGNLRPPPPIGRSSKTLPAGRHQPWRRHLMRTAPLGRRPCVAKRQRRRRSARHEAAEAA